MTAATRSLDWLLSTFTERVPQVAHTVVVSGDGLVVAASRDLPPDRAEQLASVVAGIVQLTEGLARHLNAQPVLHTMVGMGRAYLFVMALGDASGMASLACLAGREGDLGQVAFEMAQLVDQVGAALTPAVRTHEA